MENIAVSFIVPMYNMEKYISECLDGIIEQSVKTKEVIIINDGSTDASLSICDNYAKKYSYIIIINKENEGISAARNDGLNVAQGEYVCFIDSDDFYKEKFTQKYYELCKKYDLDIIRGLYRTYDDEKKMYLEKSNIQVTYYNQVLSGEEFLKKSIYEHNSEVVPWLGLFKRQYLIENKLKFPKGIAYEEDQLFFLQTLLCDKNCKVMQSDIEFYAYRKRHGSVTKTPTLEQVEDILFVVESETKLIKRYQLKKDVAVVTKRYISSSFYQLTSIYGRLGDNDKKTIKKIIPNWMKLQSIRYPYDGHQFIKILLFSYAPWFVDMVYRRKLKGINIENQT